MTFHNAAATATRIGRLEEARAASPSSRRRGQTPFGPTRDSGTGGVLARRIDRAARLSTRAAVRRARLAAQTRAAPVVVASTKRSKLPPSDAPSTRDPARETSERLARRPARADGACPWFARRSAMARSSSPRKRPRRSGARSQVPDARRRSVREDRLQAKQHSCEIGVASMTDDERVSKIRSIRQRQERVEESGPHTRKNINMNNLCISWRGVQASYASLDLGRNLRQAGILVRISVARRPSPRPNPRSVYGYPVPSSGRSDRDCVQWDGVMVPHP